MNRTTSGIPTTTRFKMFKSGRRWVYAGITVAGLGSGLMLTTNALAATNALPTPTAVSENVQPTTAASTTPAETAAAPATQPITTTTETPTTTASVVAPVTDTTQSTTTVTAPVTDTAQPTTPVVENGQPTNAPEPTKVAPVDNGTVQPTTVTVAQPTTPAPTVPATQPTTVVANAHGPVYTNNDTQLDNHGTITVTSNGPYSVTWKSVDTTTKTVTKTVTLDVSDIVAAVKDLGATAENSAQLPAVKAKLDEMISNLKELPTDIASRLVGKALYQVVFTGSGSQTLSKFRTLLDPNRYAVSDFWTGLDPVAYAADRAASEAYYPEAVTWYKNVNKETWELPEYNDPTQLVRATYIQNGDSTKTVVIGQGWTEEPDWIGYVSKIWYDLGYNVLMPSQRGQFLSDGNDITFGYQDKYDWLNWVKKVDARNGANSEVVFYGQSLGADTVIEAASVPGLSKSVKAVIADAGYATMPGLGSTLYQSAIAAVSAKLQSFGLPAITSLPFLSYDKIVAEINTELQERQGFALADISGVTAASKVTVPLMLIHTEDDSFIPYTNSLALAAANNSKIQDVWILPGQVGGHAMANGAILQYTDHLKSFLAEALGIPETPVVLPKTETDNDIDGTTAPTDVDTGEVVTESQTTSDHTTTVNDKVTVADAATNNDKVTVTDATASANTGASANAKLGQSDSTSMAAKKAAIKAALAQVDQSLVANDHSGSAVTASLLHDTTKAGDRLTATAASVHATLTPVVASTAKINAQAATTATVLPQTDDHTQAGLAALGASLMAMAAGLFMGIRRRFAKIFG